MKNGGFRKGQNPIGKAFKGIGEGIVKGLDAMAEADARMAERAQERRETERKYRDIVEAAIKDYEVATGRTFYIRGQETPAVSYSNSSHLMWDLHNKGHLVNCREDCTIHHCLECGSESYSDVYCFRHRTR